MGKDTFQMKISVIVPIYGVERFIGRCVESLMQQTMQEDVEYIFVDDTTPDRSMDVLQEVLERYPERKAQTVLLRHEVNKGLPAARNTGLAVAGGEYVFHCDSDDFVEPDMLDTLYHTAISQRADYVWCDWFLSFEKSERYMRQPACASADSALRTMLCGGLKYNVWNKLVRRQLYVKNGILFPAGYGMGEDMTMIRLLACAQKVAYVNRALYHYVRLNTNAFTSSFSVRQLGDVAYNAQKTIDFVVAQKQNKLELELACFKLNIKYPLIIGDDVSQYRLWRSWFQEANRYIGKNPMSGIRSRFLQYAARYKCDLILKLHYWLVYKVVYGIIYR